MLRPRCHNRPEPLFINYKATFRLRDLPGVKELNCRTVFEFA